MHTQLHSKSRSFVSLALICFGGLMFSLAACAPAPITYAKTGAAPGEWEQDRAACMMDAAKQVPANNQYAVTPGQEYTSRTCAHGAKDCTVYDSFTPPQMQTTDANTELRKAVYQACLAKHGWLEISTNN